MICKTEKQVSNGAHVAETLASTDDAAPVLSAKRLKIGPHEDSSAAGDNCAEHLVVFVALSEDSVESVEPVDCQ